MTFTIIESVLTDYNGSDVHVSIPNGVTQIQYPCPHPTLESKGVFYNGTFTAIDIPPSVQVIAKGSFKNCQQLSRIDLPHGILKIEEETFFNCSLLHEIILPATVKVIAENAFSGCSNLRHIHLPEGITTIERNAFSYCENLTHVILPSTLEHISTSAFKGCSQLSLHVEKSDTLVLQHSTHQHTMTPNGIKQIGSFSFNSCTLESIRLSEGVTFIRSNAFSECQSLRALQFPSSLLKIDNHSLSGLMNLTSLTVPKNVTDIGQCAFSSCYNLTSIKLLSPVTALSKQLFSHCFRLNTIKLPSSITHIKQEAFLGCKALRQIHLPQQLKHIESRSFYGCTSLQTILIPTGTTFIGQEAFKNCSNLLMLYLPSTIERIGDELLNGCNNLHYILIDNLSEYERYYTLLPAAFRYCLLLNSTYQQHCQHLHRLHRNLCFWQRQHQKASCHFSSLHWTLTPSSSPEPQPDNTPSCFAPPKKYNLPNEIIVLISLFLNNNHVAHWGMCCTSLRPLLNSVNALRHIHSNNLFSASFLHRHRSCIAKLSPSPHHGSILSEDYRLIVNTYRQQLEAQINQLHQNYQLRLKKNTTTGHDTTVLAGMPGSS